MPNAGFPHTAASLQVWRSCSAGRDLQKCHTQSRLQTSGQEGAPLFCQRAGWRVSLRSRTAGGGLESIFSFKIISPK